MIHLNKNPQALIITVPNEVHLMNTAVSGWTSLSLACTVYNIHTGLYMCRLDPDTGTAVNLGSPYGWTFRQPGHGTWAGAATPFEAYEIPLLEIGTTLHGWSPPHEFATDKYWVNLSEAHRVLELNGTGGSPPPLFASDVGGSAPTGPGAAGREGYIIAVHDHSGVGMGGPFLPIDPIYIHLTPEGVVGPVSANVVAWNGFPVTNSTQENLPNINVADWGDAGFANITLSSSGGGIPEVDAVKVNSNATAAANLEDFATAGYDPGNNEVVKVNTTTTTENIDAGGIATASFVNGAITAAKIATNAIGSDQIATNAIGSDQIAADAIGSSELQTNAITSDQIADDAIDEGAFADDAISARVIAAAAIHADDDGNGPAIEAGAIHAGVSGVYAPAIAEGAIHKDNADVGTKLPAIATDAISEGSIAIDSLTYEEISDSAIREIVNGVWNASVFSPIDYSPILDGSNPQMAPVGSMGHAMLMEYISENMIHFAPGFDGEAWATPMHMTLVPDPNGEKFYSVNLSNSPLTEDEAKSYIDRAAVLVRGISVPSGKSVRVPVSLKLIELDEYGDGWNGAEFRVFDSDGTLVFADTLLPFEGQFTFPSIPRGQIDNVDFDLLSGEEYTWEFALNTWSWEASFVLVRTDTEDVIATVTPGPSVPLGTIISGSFDLPPSDPSLHQQHLVRITSIEEDAMGQYFKIQLVDEEQSAIPGGILPTKTDMREGYGVAVRVRLNEEDSYPDGWNGAVFKAFDSNNQEVAVATLVTGAQGSDEVILTPGQQYTWELVAGAWAHEISFELVRMDTGDVLAEVFAGDFPVGNQIGVIMSGSFDLNSLPNPDLTGDILIVKAETDATMHEVAHEVWEEDVDDHATPDTFGMLNRIIAGLSQYNHQITDSTYDESGRLLACRLVVYPNAEKARSGEDPLTTIEVTSTYDEKQNMTTFKAAEEN